MDYVIGVDLGTKQDYSAIVLTRRVERVQPSRALPGTWQEQTEERYLYSTYEVPLIERPALGIDYGDVIGAVERVTQLPQLWRQNVSIVVDATGVGYPVLQQMYSRGLPVVGVTISSGTSVGQTQGGYTVPKRDLVTSLQVVYQARRIKIASRLPMAPALQEELQSFHHAVTAARNETWDAKSGKHDDIVLALALAVWYSERAYGYAVAAPTRDEARTSYNPLKAVQE